MGELVETTRMSSRGQVVIPEAIRKKLGLDSGTRFVVVGDRDTVILKTISPPSPEALRRLLADSRASARKAGLRKSDITEAVRRVRSRR